MEKIALYEGMRVHYAPEYGKKQNGIIKSFRDKDPWSNQYKNAFVVYQCGGNWHNYKDYTGAMTPVSTLKPGWTKTISFKNLLKEKHDFTDLKDAGVSDTSERELHVSVESEE